MRKLSIVLLVLISAAALFAQGASAAKPAASAKTGAMAEPKAIIDTTAGKINCMLFPDKAPKSVENFIGLAKGTKDWTDPITHQKKHGVPLYDGTIFHRVIPGFMIQGGDPAGNGTGNPGYGFGLEISPDLKYDRPGRLAYARTSDPNTNGSQFFITAQPTPALDGQYTIFGQCDNPDVVQTIINAPRNSNDLPYNPTKINHITIVMPGAAAKAKVAMPKTGEKQP
jgi:peptidyl-prolyl cis-trans isomerase A (cyclophilin A)